MSDFWLKNVKDKNVDYPADPRGAKDVCVFPQSDVVTERKDRPEALLNLVQAWTEWWEPKGANGVWNAEVEQLAVGGGEWIHQD